MTRQIEYIMRSTLYLYPLNSPSPISTSLFSSGSAPLSCDCRIMVIVLVCMIARGRVIWELLHEINALSLLLPLDPHPHSGWSRRRWDFPSPLSLSLGFLVSRLPLAFWCCTHINIEPRIALAEFPSSFPALFFLISHASCVSSVEKDFYPLHYAHLRLSSRTKGGFCARCT